jgi:hypothetical protein
MMHEITKNIQADDDNGKTMITTWGNTKILDNYVYRKFKIPQP